MGSRNSIRIAFAVLLFVVAAIPPVLLLLDAEAPGRAARITGSVWAVAVQSFWYALAAALVAALVYPPTMPWLRLLLRGMRERLTVDQSPMFQALGRLEHHETADDHFAIAQVRWQLRDIGKVLFHVNRALELDPRCTKARFLGAKALFDIGQVPHAANAYAQVVAADEQFGFGDALLGLGRCLVLLGQDADAVRALERHETIYGPSRRALVLRARLARREHDGAAARELLRRAAQPPGEGEPMSLEEQLARARARVALWRLGGVA
ncbi:MAG: hypothetical protein KDB80_11930 [Planctomycetes bacterium]|nr:hypothetical protein [Planctomycetota bacterium]